jgi:hypothetical protein
MLSGAVLTIAPSYCEPAGGRHHKPPEYVNRSAQVGPDLWVTLTTAWTDHRPVYRVRLVDSHNNDHREPQELPTPRRARNAANRLYAELTEED